MTRLTSFCTRWAIHGSSTKPALKPPLCPDVELYCMPNVKLRLGNMLHLFQPFLKGLETRKSMLNTSQGRSQGFSTRMSN